MIPSLLTAATLQRRGNPCDSLMMRAIHTQLLLARYLGQ